MATGLDYIKGALKLLGSYVPEEDVDGDDGATSFEFLNNMLDSWSSVVGPVFAETQESFPLVTGTIQYTLGPSGDMVTTRPVTILKAYVRDNQDVDHELRLMPNREYQDIALKDPGSWRPHALGYNMTNPNITLLFYPTPDSSYTFRITSNKVLSAATMASTYAVPPGYDLAIKYNLACEIAPIFGADDKLGNPMNPKSIAGRAVSLYDNLVMMNTEPEGIDQDPLLPGGDNVLPSWKYRY